MIKIESSKINEICSQYVTYIISRPRRIKSNIYLQYLFDSERMHSIISCPADKLKDFILDFEKHFPETDPLEWKSFQTYMINQYKLVRNEYLPHVLDQLDLSVCPYCNRHYIYTVNKGKKVGAQFDHFYSKSKYPYLALSFYNLIPCCPSCNKTKGDDEININPYIEGFNSECIIQIDNPVNSILGNEEWTIELVGNERMASNITTFALNELYKHHRDVAQEIVYKSIANSDGFLSCLKTEFRHLGVDDDFIHRIIWGIYGNEHEMCKRPLSKMTLDIIKQMKGLH